MTPKTIEKYAKAKPSELRSMLERFNEPTPENIATLKAMLNAWPDNHRNTFAIVDELHFSLASKAAKAGAKNKAPLSLAKLDGLPEAPQDGDPDAVMGQQLAAQWDRVVSGQRDQLIFGAMMLKVRESVSARGHAKPGRGADKGAGLKGWLEKYAPKIARQTAYRLMEIAEGVAAEFKLGKSVDLEALLAGQVENLDDKLKAKRAKIEECIEGRSQRQLLLQFGRAEPAKMTGGKRENTKEPTAEERLTAWERAAQADLEALASLAKALGDRWKASLITDAEREAAADQLEGLAAAMRKWVATPKNRRTAAPVPALPAA